MTCTQRSAFALPNSLSIALGALLAFTALPLRAAPFTLEVFPRNTVALEVYGASPIRRQSDIRLDERADGDEKSECRPFGRKSSALGTADLKILEKRSDGVTFNILADSASFGGQYRNCVTCALQNCVGRFLNDTQAKSNVSSTAVLAIKFDSDASIDPYLVDISVAAHGKSPILTLSDQRGQEIAASSALGGSYEISGGKGKVYYLSVQLEITTANTGSCCDEKTSASSLVDVKIRKAPLLASQGRYQPFIRGGEETPSYQNVGAILIDGRLHCTGTLVGSRTVLTAAHCLHGYEKQIDKFSFLVGSNLLQPTFGPVKVQDYAYPNGTQEGYRFNPATLEDDIGVLYLDTPSTTTPVKLHTGIPSWNDIEKTNTSLVFVGYGYDVIENELMGSGIKREAAWAINAVENRRVRFSVPGKNTCKGDSGGPAFLIKNGSIVQVAVTSGGTADCSSGFETRVDAFFSWIEARIK